MLARSSYDSAAFGKYFFPDTFFVPFVEQHIELIRLLDDPTKRKVNIRAGRGFGKSSIVTRGSMARRIAWRQNRFVLYIGTGETLASQKTENLKRALAKERRLRKYFPTLKFSDPEGMDPEFTKTSWVAYNHTLVMARGCLQPVRGLLYDEFRPDYIVLDDITNTEFVGNEEYRNKQWEWLRGDVEPAVSRYDSNWKIVHIDTVKHEDGLSERLAELPDWTTVTFPLVDADYHSLVPSLITDAEVAEMVESHRKGGTLDVFYREYMCLPIATESASFRQSMFQQYSETSSDFRKRIEYLQNIVLVDPARTENPSSAESAVVGVGIDRAPGAVYVRDIVSERMSPERLQDEAIEMALRLHSSVIAIETTGLGSWGRWPIENEIRRRGLPLRLVELKAAHGKAEKGKIERIKGLIPMYRRGQVFHNPTCCHRLEQQLLGFPRSRLWDQMDALAYIVEVMDKMDAYFLFGDSEDPEYDYEGEYAGLPRERYERSHTDQLCPGIAGLRGAWA